MDYIIIWTRAGKRFWGSLLPKCTYENITYILLYIDKTKNCVYTMTCQLSIINYL